MAAQHSHRLDAVRETEAAHAIIGLTHPKTVLRAATNLWKKRGTLSAAVSTNWVERLFVLTDTALFWFEMGGISTQCGRIELRHIQRLHLIEAAGNPSVSVDELERHGPKYQLEVSHVMSEQKCLIGCGDHGTVQAWHGALTAAIEHASAHAGGTTPTSGDSARDSFHSARERADSAPTSPHAPPAPPALLRLELTGIVAIGTLGKARQAMTGAMKSSLEKTGVLKTRELRDVKDGKSEWRIKDGWSTRVVVLSESALHFYKPIHRKVAAAAAPPPRPAPLLTAEKKTARPHRTRSIRRGAASARRCGRATTSSAARSGACRCRWPTCTSSA